MNDKEKLLIRQAEDKLVLLEGSQHIDTKNDCYIGSFDTSRNHFDAFQNNLQKLKKALGAVEKSIMAKVK